MKPYYQYGFDSGMCVFPFGIIIYFQESRYNWIRISFMFLNFYFDISFPYPKKEVVSC